MPHSQDVPLSSVPVRRDDSSSLAPYSVGWVVVQALGNLNDLVLHLSRRAVSKGVQRLVTDLQMSGVENVEQKNAVATENHKRQ